MPAFQRVALAYNNVYLVEDGDERSLIDTGPDYRGAMEALLEALGPQRPSLVVATHGHADHAGLGHAWQQAGASVAIAASDARMVTHAAHSDPADIAGLRTFVTSSAAPPEVITEALQGLARRSAWADAARNDYPPPGSHPRWPTGLRMQPFTPDALLSDGNPLPGGLRVLAAPGHTPGNLVIEHPGEGWLFSGDQLLPDITPTPAIQGSQPGSLEWRFRSLPAFAASLRRLTEREYSRCFPGHGEPFDNVGVVLRLNLDAIEQRTAKVADALRDFGPATLYDLSERLYPRAVRRRFWQIAPTVLGHLDLLEGEARIRQEDGRYFVV